MTQQDYEKAKVECWEDYTRKCAHEGKFAYGAFCFAFDRAYALGKQEKDAQEEEMLMCEKSRVQKIFAGQTEAQKSTPCGTILHHEAAAKAELLYTLFDSKCLPDVEPKPAEPKEEADKHFDTILRDGFRNERRLNIAVQMAKSIIESSEYYSSESMVIVRKAFEITDALLAECKKGGTE